MKTKEQMLCERDRLIERVQSDELTNEQRKRCESRIWTINLTMAEVYSHETRRLAKAGA